MATVGVKGLNSELFSTPKRFARLKLYLSDCYCCRRSCYIAGEGANDAAGIGCTMRRVGPSQRVMVGKRRRRPTLSTAVAL